ncbi:MAG: hypothetical protein LBI35_09435 [Burkholderiales bacterium]|jgi:hypothetical protein|nr:hypothetical protein [Burkholderiales bacterium]
MSIPCHLPPHKAQLIKVIFVPVTVGSGADDDPERMAYFYYATDGKLLSCYDPFYGLPENPEHTRAADRAERGF